MNYKLGVFLILGCITFFTACKKEDFSTTLPSSEGDIILHIHSYMDTIEIEDYASEYVLQDSLVIKFDTLLIKIKNIKLALLDNNIINFPNLELVKTLDKESYELGLCKVGNYKSLFFEYSLQIKATVNDTLSLHFYSDTLPNKVSLENLNYTVLPNLYNYIHLKVNYKDLLTAIIHSKNSLNAEISKLLPQLIAQYEHNN